MTSAVVAVLLVGTLGCAVMAIQGGAGRASGDGLASAAHVEIVAGTGERLAAPSTDPLVVEGDILEGTEGDASYSEAGTTRVSLADGASLVDGTGASVSGDVITITEAGTYALSGELANGQVVVDAADADVRVVLDGAHLTRSGGAALYVADARRLTITLAAGTSNELASSGPFPASDDDVDAAVFSHDGLVINGDGTLQVTAGDGRGIVSKDELVIAGGTLSVSCAGNAIEANDWLAVTAGEVTLSCEGDALRADSDDAGLGLVYLGGGSITIAQANDGVHASGHVQVAGGTVSAQVADDAFHADGSLQVAGGRVGVASSHEGIEAASVTIAGGEVTLVAADDGINAMGVAGVADGDDAAEGAGDPTALLAITGGRLAIDSAGDGIDSNGSIVITGGTVAISAGAQGADNTAIDYVTSATIDGGAIIACGQADGAVGFVDGSAQSSALVTLAGPTEGTVTIESAAGDELASFVPTKAYECVIVSTPDLAPGESHTLRCGNESYLLQL